MTTNLPSTENSSNTVIDTRKTVKLSLKLHTKLAKLAKKNRRTLAAQLEYIIDNA